MDLPIAKRLRILEYSLDDLHRKVDMLFTKPKVTTTKPKKRVIRGEKGQQCIVYIVENKTREKKFKLTHKRRDAVREFLSVSTSKIQMVIDNHKKNKIKVPLDYDPVDECYYFTPETIEQFHLPSHLLDEKWRSSDIVFRLRFHSECLSSKVFNSSVLHFEDPRDAVGVMEKIQDLFIEYCLRMDYMKHV